MKYVIGIDLGTSAVKLLLVNQFGDIENKVSKSYPLIQKKIGYSEQDPEEWVNKTIIGLRELISSFKGNITDIEGLSFSGQMHSLVLLDKNKEILRNAILWNDTRTTKQCKEIYNKIGKEKMLSITKNLPLEGFTLPKIMWVKENEPEIFNKASVFLLPKDYLRFRITGQLHMEYSDAAGTGILDLNFNKWSKEICKEIGIDSSLCPPLINSHAIVGNISADISYQTGLAKNTKVFAGAADNACGAIGAGVLTKEKSLCSIGTSGVILTLEEKQNKNYEGKVHYFNHAISDSYYIMGVTLSAGNSLNWFKTTFFKNSNFNKLLKRISQVPIGSNGLLFTPYLVGERTPYIDPNIRSSFIGIDNSHTVNEFVRAVVEGITFSLNESIEILRENGKTIDRIYAIGGGAKSEEWLQIQADIFDATIVRIKNEEGPSMGAAMLAAVGCGWFKSLKACANVFIKEDKVFKPRQDNVYLYQKLFNIYKKVYKQTNGISKDLMSIRNLNLNK